MTSSFRYIFLIQIIALIALKESTLSKLSKVKLSEVRGFLEIIHTDIKVKLSEVRGFLEIIHTDICGPFPIKYVDDFDSFMTFTDDFLRYGYIYPIKK
jgi:hypothetical protein